MVSVIIPLKNIIISGATLEMLAVLVEGPIHVGTVAIKLAGPIQCGPTSGPIIVMRNCSRALNVITSRLLVVISSAIDWRFIQNGRIFPVINAGMKLPGLIL